MPVEFICCITTDCKAETALLLEIVVVSFISDGGLYPDSRSILERLADASGLTGSTRVTETGPQVTPPG